MKNGNWFVSSHVEAEWRFQAFGLPHFLYFIFGILIIAALAFYVRRYGQYRGAAVIRGCSLALFIFYFFRAYMFYQYYESFELLDIAPLHLCIISGFILPITVFTKNRLLWNLSYGVLMPGALAAILTPEVTLSGYHAFGWMPLIFFMWHFLVVLIPVLQLVSGELVPDYRFYPKIVFILALYALFIFILNKQLKTNYLYLNGAAKGTVLELFEGWLGNPGYIIPMALLVLLVSFLMFMPWVKKVSEASQFSMP